jgi:hypothetical protein
MIRQESNSALFVCRHWLSDEMEISFVARSLAGAISRQGPVAVVTTAKPGPPIPDGAFDIFGTGQGMSGSWPSPANAAWPSSISKALPIVIDLLEDASQELIEAKMPDSPVFAILSEVRTPERCHASPLNFVDTSTRGDSDFIGIHVPINPLAASHRHNGLGFTDYILVLSDRTGMQAVNPPTSHVAWLTARFTDADIVVVENATAAVWRGRALRGIVPIDTRTDLWRLLAHARMLIDLAPGPIIARECIETLRFGVPVIVPVDCAASAHAHAGGGLTFSDVPTLLECVTHLSDSVRRSGFASKGKAYADLHFGAPDVFIEQVARRILGRVN